jgi:hypothetical protein
MVNKYAFLKTKLCLKTSTKLIIFENMKKSFAPKNLNFSFSILFNISLQNYSRPLQYVLQQKNSFKFLLYLIHPINREFQ